eukprot:c14395_g1_i2 orf=315-566(+)
MKMAMCRCLGTDSYVKIFWSRRRLASQCQRMWTTIKPCAAVYALDPSSLNRYVGAVHLMCLIGEGCLDAIFDILFYNGVFYLL